MGLFGRSRREKIQRVSPLRPQQEQLFSQLQATLSGEPSGGAFGELGDFYRGLLSGEGAEQFEAPLRRQFQEEILPGIAEQFAGMGAGGLQSGGFAQETGRAGTDLAERLGAMRAGLRQEGAAGLSGLAQTGLSPVDEMLFRPRQPGGFEKFLGAAGGGLGTAVGTALGGPFASGIGGLGGLFKKSFLQR